MSQPFLGTIILFGFNFAPRGWAFCQGQLMAITQNQALFALLGTTYGGNGITTFGLPDLRGRVPVGMGQGPGLSNYQIGQVAGVEQLALNVTQMPSHTHVVTLTGLTATHNAVSNPGNQPGPGGNLPAAEAAGVTATYSNLAPNTTMAPGAISITGNPTAALTGGNQPFQILQPYLGLNYCIAVEGIFPSRN